MYPCWTWSVLYTCEMCLVGPDGQAICGRAFTILSSCSRFFQNVSAYPRTALSPRLDFLYCSCQLWPFASFATTSRVTLWASGIVGVGLRFQKVETTSDVNIVPCILRSQRTSSVQDHSLRRLIFVHKFVNSWHPDVFMNISSWQLRYTSCCVHSTRCDCHHHFPLIYVGQSARFYLGDALFVTFP